MNTIIVEAQARAAAILAKHKDDLVRLRDELLEKKTIESGPGERDHRRGPQAVRRSRWRTPWNDPPLPTTAPDDRTPLDKPADGPPRPAVQTRQHRGDVDRWPK